MSIVPVLNSQVKHGKGLPRQAKFGRGTALRMGLPLHTFGVAPCQRVERPPHIFWGEGKISWGQLPIHHRMDCWVAAFGKGALSTPCKIKGWEAGAIFSLASLFKHFYSALLLLQCKAFKRFVATFVSNVRADTLALQGN